MPDAPAAAHTGTAKLTHKVGPLPVWAYAVIAVGIWYWYTHYGPGAGKTAAAASASAAPADASIGSNEVTTALYPDDAAWASAAIAYLTGIGVPQSQATTEVDNYLRGLPNTAQGQSDVQLAINSVGPPPVNAPGAPAPGGKPPVTKPPVKKPGDDDDGKCKDGWHFEKQSGTGKGTLPVGAYRVKGGVCVQNHAPVTSRKRGTVAA